MNLNSNPKIGSFSEGLKGPIIAGTFLFKNKKLWPFCFIPLGVAILVILGVWVGFKDVSILPKLHFNFENYYFTKPKLEGFLDYIWYGIWFVGYYAFSFFAKGIFWLYGILETILRTVFTFILINLLSSPFLDLLSEKVEQRLSGQKSQNPFQMNQFISESLLAVKVEIQKTLFFVAGAILLFLFGLIPVLGILFGSILSPLWTLWWTSFTYCDFSQSRNNLNFNERIKFGTGHFGPFTGLGISLYIIMFLPVLNFFLLPLAVTAGTILVFSHELSETKNEIVLKTASSSEPDPEPDPESDLET